MKKLLFKFSLLGFMYLMGCAVTLAQLGIGTNAPKARLHVYDGTFFSQTPVLPPQDSPFYDPVNFDNDPVHHGLKWLHEKGAFRASGTGVPSLAFDPANAGKCSFAAGFDAFATGLAGSAFGMRSHASGFGSFATGQYVTAYHNYCFAQGYFADANGPNCVTLGVNLDNNYQIGSFIMGYDSFHAGNTGDHQIRMLFEGGYRFFTSNLLISGVLLLPGDNSWSVVSDVGRKENFEQLKKKEILGKIGGVRTSSWNYKGQDPKAFRHYGPMAQDFFEAFGHDSYGTIGADTTINQADLDGVSLMAIQALIEETDELQRMNADLERQLADLRMLLANNQPVRLSGKGALVAGKRR